MASVAPLTLFPLEKKVVYDPVTDLNAQRTYFIEKSGNMSTHQPTSTTNYSNSQITWNVNVPSKGTIIDRFIMARVPVRISVTGNAPLAGNLVQLNQGLVALRSFPLNQSITSVSMQINNQSVSSQPYEYISAMQHAKIYQKGTNIDMSTFPSLPDNCQSYDQLLGASNNVLNAFSSSDYWQQGRGSFPVTVSAGSTGNLTTSAYIDFIVTEPIMISPLLFAPDQLENGFIHVNTFTLQLQLGQLNRMLSVDAVNANALTSVSTSISGSPELLLRYITPDIIEPIPEQIMYPYEEIVVQQTGNTSIASGASNTLVSNNIQLSQIPSKIYVYARRQDSDLQSSIGYQYADAFASISGVSINFNNVSGILAQATQQDLWKLSTRNGMNIPWDAWVGSGPTSTAESISPIGVGSILCLEPFQDFGLPSNMAPGLFGEQFNLQLNLSVTNISSAAVTYTLFIVYVQDGILTLSENGSALLQTGILTKNDIVNSRSLERVPYQAAMTPWGGSFKKKLASFGHSVLSGLRKAAPYIKKGAQVALELAPLLAAGGSSVGGSPIGGMMVPHKKVTKKLQGMTRKQLTYY